MRASGLGASDRVRAKVRVSVTVRVRLRVTATLPARVRHAYGGQSYARTHAYITSLPVS